MGKPIIDLTGRVVGDLVVTGRENGNRRGRSIWQCRCKCGKLVTVDSGSLQSANTRSCGCSKKSLPGVDKPTKAKMYELYVIEGLSTHSIGRKYGNPAITILRWLKEYGIPIRSKADALRNACNNGLCDKFLKSGRNPEHVSNFMKTLWSDAEFRKKGIRLLRKASRAQSKAATLHLNCAFCGTNFERLKCYADRSLRRGATKLYCSRGCANKDRIKSLPTPNCEFTQHEQEALARILGKA